VRQGLRAIHRDRIVRTLALTAFTWDLMGSIIGVVILLFLVRTLRLAPLALGPLFGIGGFSAFVGAVLAQRIGRRFGLGRTLIGSLYVNNVGLLAIVVAGGPLALVLFLVAVEQSTDGGRAIYEIHSLSLRQRHVPEHLAGRVNATFTVLTSAAMLLGLAIGGILGQTIGLRETLLLALVGNMMVPLLLVFSPIRSISRLK
jgi:MFS family permease